MSKIICTPCSWRPPHHTHKQQRRTRGRPAAFYASCFYFLLVFSAIVLTRSFHPEASVLLLFPYHTCRALFFPPACALARNRGGRTGYFFFLFLMTHRQKQNQKGNIGQKGSPETANYDVESTRSPTRRILAKCPYTNGHKMRFGTP